MMKQFTEMKNSQQCSGIM